MKEAIYSWIKCLAIFYILLTMLIHLVPTGKYQRYVRFFMGLLLMVMLITPMLSILEKAKTLPESFSSLYQQEEKKRLTLDLENLQKSLLEKGVEEQLEKNIPESLKKKGIEVTACKVHIEGELLKVCLWTKEVPDGELERGIKDLPVFSPELSVLHLFFSQKKLKKRNCFLLPGSYPFYRIPEVQLP